jgi:hypothetical protein
MDVYLLDGEFYCEDCGAPKVEREVNDDPDFDDEFFREVDDKNDEIDDTYPDGGGESDTPQHCAQCHRPLENPLTKDGVNYVLEAIRDELSKPRSERNKVATHWKEGEYYAGCTATAVVRDWAEQLKYYCLDEEDARMVDWYLDHSSSVPDSPA